MPNRTLGAEIRPEFIECEGKLEDPEHRREPETSSAKAIGCMVYGQCHDPIMYFWATLTSDFSFMPADLHNLKLEGSLKV
jgi:hypothetical protein